VVGFGSTTLPACAIAAAATETPFVYRSIGDLTYWANTPAKRLRVRTMLARAQTVVALWPEAGRNVTQHFGVPAERVRVIPRGVDPAAYDFVPSEQAGQARARLGLPGGGPLLCFVGSLSEEKSLETAISALAALPGHHLVVAGDGPCREALEIQGRSDAPGRVHFLGQLADPRDVYAAADLLVLPSLSEGIPGVVLEAGLIGRPAIATAVGGTPSVIDDGITGVLFEQRDVDALAAAVRLVMADASAMGISARERYAQNFALDRIATAWMKAILHSVRRTEPSRTTFR
jgi:glycosyltransferase involved in cell wall biosynthesis